MRKVIRGAARGLSVSVACAAACLSGCTTTSPGAVAAGAAADASDMVECVADSGLYAIDTYEPNLQKAGLNGLLMFDLVSTDPAPPEQGEGKFVVKVTHADGSPFHGTLIVAPNEGVWMPLHGHGADIPAVITFDAVQSTYTLFPMDFIMVGLWRITLQAFEAPDAGEAGPADSDADPTDDAGPSDDAAAVSTVPALPTDTAVFYFCL
jgi:hypothetical protein